MTDIEIKELQSRHKIKDVALKLGLQFKYAEGRTSATHCFSDRHPNGDRHPSLILKPDQNGWKCLSCGVGGDILKLIQGYKKCSFLEACEFLEPGITGKKQINKNLFTPIDKNKYWNSRGISDETKRMFGLELKDDGLYIPLPNGSVKRRNFLVENPKFIFTVQHGACIFKAGEKAPSIMLTEGELDAIKAYQETGMTAWSGTTGAGSFKDEWKREFDGIKKIYIIPDTDDPGQKGAERTANILGAERCYKVDLPKKYKDLTEFFIDGNTKDTLRPLLISATRYSAITEIDSPMRYDALSEIELRTRKNIERLKIGLYKMDFGSFQFHFPAGFYIIAAAQGVGKSWFALFLIHQFYLLHQKKAILFTLEMSEEQLRHRAIQAWSNLTQEQYENDGDISQGINLLKQEIMLVIPFGMEDASTQTPENFERKVDQYYSEGRRIFLFDHIHQLKGLNDSQTAPKVADKWSAAVQRICKKFPDIWVFMFAQVKKDAIKKDILHKQDIRFGSEFIDRCDVFLSLNKKLQPDSSYWEEKNEGENRDDQDENRDIILFLDKNRLTDVPAGRGWKLHHSKTGNFSEIPYDFMQEQNRLSQQKSVIEWDNHSDVLPEDRLNQDNLFDNLYEKAINN